MSGGSSVDFSELSFADEFCDGIVCVNAFDGAGGLLHLNLTNSQHLKLTNLPKH